MTLSRILRFHRYWYVLGLLLADGLFFSFTNPTKAVSQLLIVGFVLLAVSLYVLLALIGRALVTYGGLSRATTTRVSRLTAVVLIILLGMQSVGQLSPRDVAALVPLVVVGYVYLAYARRQRESA